MKNKTKLILGLGGLASVATIAIPTTVILASCSEETSTDTNSNNSNTEGTNQGTNTETPSTKPESTPPAPIEQMVDIEKFKDYFTQFKSGTTDQNLVENKITPTVDGPNIVFNLPQDQKFIQLTFPKRLIANVLPNLKSNPNFVIPTAPELSNGSLDESTFSPIKYTIATPQEGWSMTKNVIPAVLTNTIEITPNTIIPIKGTVIGLNDMKAVFNLNIKFTFA